MRLEGEPRSDILITAVLVVDGVVLAADGKLRAYRDILVVWDLRDVPSGIACWVAIVATLLLVLSAVEVSVEIHLFSGIVLIDQFSASLEIVDAVLD